MDIASTSEKNPVHGQFVVVGGGVAGICCVEELDSIITDDSKIILITGRGGFIKTVVNPERLGQITETFEIEEKISDAYFSSGKVISIKQDVVSWNSKEKKLHLSNGKEVTYDKLCIATGASAKSDWKHPSVITIRDTETIESLRAKLHSTRRVLLVGNGGIATELVFELKNVEILWAIRHPTISATYFDAAAAKFFEPMLLHGRPSSTKKPEAKVDRYVVDRKPIVETAPERLGLALLSQDMNESSDGATTIPVDTSSSAIGGCALGPHWLAKLNQDEISNSQENQRKVHVISEAELTDVYDEKPQGKRESTLPDNFQRAYDWKAWAEFSNGSICGCDLIIQATGVVPNSKIWHRDCPELKISEDGGILVGEKMETSVPNVYAVGDACTAGWQQAPHWTQIRLWTQARQMGIFCARAMIFPDIQLDIAFELFTHATTFFGLKVVLLGDFTASKIEKPFQVFMRITEREEYIKVITKDGRVHGAVLIGETDLEETLENLILNQTDISQIEDDFLNPQVDLEDYFD